ncbi:hypothetical protein [Flavobacterium yafengii]|uniref:hypothetical protein n=1 Tax=Flavobacterium yafengii TaxID=3041253 RepID=UPI0024A84EB6|nr:hypothetical protein [Flavobacterium yafengii]MDI5887603.1 hypothetical protein [Flavobacterium yafengii]
MKFPMYLEDGQIEQLEYEVLSKDFYIYLTRFFNHWCEETNDFASMVMRKNKLINLSRSVSGGKIYTLNVDDWGEFMSEELAWHESHFFLIFRDLSIFEFIEFAGDLIKLDYCKPRFLNDLLKKEGASFKFYYSESKLKIEILSIEEIEKANLNSEHINIRTLVNRMDVAYEQNDFASVLHSSASIFETMAKDIIGIETIQDKTLKSFFDRYKTDSKLPTEVLDYILATYDKRNITSLAGHGSLTIPNITKEESIILIEMTKAFVRIEYRIQREI